MGMEGLDDHFPALVCGASAATGMLTHGTVAAVAAVLADLCAASSAEDEPVEDWPYFASVLVEAFDNEVVVVVVGEAAGNCSPEVASAAEHMVV